MNATKNRIPNPLKASIKSGTSLQDTRASGKGSSKKKAEALVAEQLLAKIRQQGNVPAPKRRQPRAQTAPQQQQPRQQQQQQQQQQQPPQGGAAVMYGGGKELSRRLSGSTPAPIIAPVLAGQQPVRANPLSRTTSTTRAQMTTERFSDLPISQEAKNAMSQVRYVFVYLLF